MTTKTLLKKTSLLKKTTTLLIAFLLLHISSFAQLYPIPLKERIDSSEKVIIGQVIDANSYWDADSSNIYTAYTMKVVCYGKNWDTDSFFDLILPGGTVGEDIQIDYPYMQLDIGYEYLVAVENVTLYNLPRKHARSSRPSFQPYSYVQGILPMHNGRYKDYFDTVSIPETILMDSLQILTGEQATDPAGSAWTARDTFIDSNGDIDNDGVLDIYDIDPSDPNSNSDGDGYTDIEEKNGAPNLPPSNPLNPCDPEPSIGGLCIPIDMDNDSLYGNYPSWHQLYDPDDADACIPNNSTTNGCVPIDADGDGYFGNYPITDAYYDPDDSSECIPDNAMAKGCPPEDLDQDGLFGNADPTANNYDPNDLNPCDPQVVFDVPIIFDTYIDESNQSVNFGTTDSLLLSSKQGEEKRILMRFDLSMLPPHVPMEAYLSSSTILFRYFVDNPNGAVPEIFAHTILQPWEAGQGNSSGANWNMAGNGASWQPGGHYEPGMNIPLYSFYPGWNEVDISPLFHQAINDPNHFGFLLKINSPIENTIYSILSAESGYPPSLIIHTDVSFCNIPPPTNRLAASTVTLKNGAGELTNSFIGGTIEEDLEMVVQGSGFGTETGHVQFANADTGGFTQTSIDKSTDFVHWTDTEIRFKIPKKAGTGDMTIVHKNGNTISTKPITINWSMSPIYHKPPSETSKFRQRTHFVNINEAGGYNIKINTSTGFASNTEALAAFERALASWQCATNINWVLTDNTTNESGKDGICVLEFSTALPQGVLAIASSRYKGSSSSSCTEHNLFWRINEFDISFADPSILPTGFNWNFSSGTPSANEFDFESIALHELGHAHGLAHVIDESSVMHFSILNGEMKRDLATHETDGAQHKMAHSTTDNCVSSFDPMVAMSSPCATPAAINKTNIKVLLEGFYDISTGNMTTLLQDAVLIPDAQPFNKAPFNYTGSESITSIPLNVVDWVLLELRDPTDQDNILHQMALFLKNDGTIVNLDGTPDIALDGVQSGNYYISIGHSNHLSVISNTPHTIGATASLYDFSSAASSAMGIEQLKEINGQYFLYSGDFDGNGLINNQDYNLWKINSSSLNVYTPADADGNGLINNRDYNLWKVNLSKIGLITR